MQTVVSLGEFIGEKQSVRPYILTLLYLFPDDCLSAPSFTAPPACVFYGAVGKYTTSCLIISRPVVRSHFFCVVLTTAFKHFFFFYSTSTAGKQSSLWPSHLSDAPLVTALWHITCLALVLEVPDLLLWRRPEEERRVGGNVGSTGQLTSSSCSFNRDT